MKYLIFFIASIIGNEAANAQKLNEESKSIYGSFGHFFIGPAFVQSQKLTDYLKQSDVLGNDYSPHDICYSIGGEGGAMFARFYLGGGGFGLIKVLFPPLTKVLPLLILVVVILK